MHTNFSADKVAIVILAAGKGTRINKENGGLPKVLTPLYGQPLISHLLHSIEDSAVKRPPVIVVGYKGDLVRETLGPYYTYVEQTEQLGTGHAVRCAREALEGQVENVVVLYGDQPHLPHDVVDRLITQHVESGNTLTMTTTTVDDFDGWRERLRYYGHIVRNSAGEIQQVVEFKEATEEQRESKEVNPGHYCFKASWLWSHLDHLSNTGNSAGEYYLTDLIGVAIGEHERIGTIAIDPLHSLAVNTLDELHVLEGVLKNVGDK